MGLYFGTSYGTVEDLILGEAVDTVFIGEGEEKPVLLLIAQKRSSLND
jgi:hypothetical protein